MPPTLGKRKRVTRAELEQPSRSPSPSSDSDNDSNTEDLHAIFKRAFEAKFKPLPVEAKKPKLEEVQLEEDEEEGSEASDAESAWSGLSDSEPQIEVIEYTDRPRNTNDPTARAEAKAFMSAKIPSSTSTPSTTASNKRKGPLAPTADDDTTTDSTNLKNDLALQKLLRESHILSASASSSGTSTPTSLAATGMARHKANDLHLQALGAKSSVFTQKKMPMAQRKYEAAKARVAEERRRAHAKEAGIVLEREKRAAPKAKGGERKRERGVGGPSIGKFSGGTLTLSKRDVRSITGGGGAKGKGKDKGKGKSRMGKIGGI